MTKTTTTYALPDEPRGPVWDKDGNKWEREGGLWKTGGYVAREWSVLLRDYGPLTNTEPAPDWPTAPLVWHDGEVWTRQADDLYESASDIWEERHMTSSLSSDIRDDARRFARAAVPVVPVPAAEWEAFAPLARGSVTSGSFTLEAARDLVRAADGLGVAR